MKKVNKILDKSWLSPESIKKYMKWLGYGILIVILSTLTVLSEKLRL